MLDEGLQQYRDYYESDAEEQQAFEYLDNLDNRGRIRFVECFRDWTQDHFGRKDYISIAKREFNPELSAFSNMVLDLVDFRDRVRPMANDISLLDAARRFQSRDVDELKEENARVRQEIRDMLNDSGKVDTEHLKKFVYTHSPRKDAEDLEMI